jgi:hypothetical protein
VDTWAEWAQPAVSTLALMLARQQHILGAQQRHSGERRDKLLRAPGVCVVKTVAGGSSKCSNLCSLLLWCSNHLYFTCQCVHMWPSAV